ncbi:MAG: deoxynucleoside kinase [Pseudomonadota bacterium]
MEDSLTTTLDTPARLVKKISQASEHRTLPKYIAVEGPIGVGKTTLAVRLAQTFGYQTLLEPAAENPFLNRFYSEGEQHALPAQLFFLLHRAQQLASIPGDDLLGRMVVADFLMQKDELFARLTLDEHEFSLYQQIQKSLNIQAPTPDLVIYLQAPTEVLQNRISHRGIKFEQHIRSDYLLALTESYTEFFYYYDAAPLLIVNAAELDIANEDEHFEALLDQILTMDSNRQFYNPQPSLL